MTEWFLSAKLAFPWSLPIVGPWLLGAVALAIAAFTVLGYRGHAEASKRRIGFVLVLRLLALLMLVLTAIRPTAGVQEKPQVPTKLLIGVDLSESLTIRDAVGGQSRIEAVRAVLAKCQPTLDALRDEQNCDVVLYGFGSLDFAEAAGAYDPKVPADRPRSDYGRYLAETLQRWQTERFIRGHAIIGDGADNGTLPAFELAAKWRGVAPIQTFAVGDPRTASDRKDVALKDAALDPNPVAVKNKVTLRLRANAIGLAGLTAPLTIEFDADGKGYKKVLETRVKLSKDVDNQIEVTDIAAPEELPIGPDGQPRKQIKVRIEIPVAQVPGDTNPSNNVLETYLALNKEGLRVLVVDRYRFESSLMLDALSADPRIDIRKVDLQTDEGGTGTEKAFDFEAFAYDVIILGNVTPKQLDAVSPGLPERIAKRVREKGMGFLMIGGHATLAGTEGNGAEAANGWRGIKAFEDLLPVSLADAPRQPEKDRPRYQVIPDERSADAYLAKIADTSAESLALWETLNKPASKSRFTGLNRVGKVKDGATVYLWARDTDGPIDLAKPPNEAKQFPLLVGQQFDGASKSRVLVLAAQDTMLWQRLGQPKTDDGKKLHSRFWRQLVLWLAKQDEDDANAFIRPDFPRLPAGTLQGFGMGLKGPNGAAATETQFEVTLAAPGDPAGKPLAVTFNSQGEARASATPLAPGEYIATVKARGKALVKGKLQDVQGVATGRFLAYPEVSDEMLIAAANEEFLKKLAVEGGGQFHRLEDLPAYLSALRSQPYDIVKPKPKYRPDWRRDQSHGFLPGWLIAFAVLLGVEWGLRRWWGLA